MDLSRCRIPLRDQVVTCLLILRQNLPQMVVADLPGVCQPTISRILVTYHRPPRSSPALPPGRTGRGDPARAPHPHRRHPCPLPGTAQPADKPATSTPGNAISSASMSRSPPPTEVTSSLSPARCRDPDTTRRPSTCTVGKTSSTPPTPPGSPTPPTSPPPPSPRSRSYPTSPTPNTTKTSTLPSPESASTSNTASHN